MVEKRRIDWIKTPGVPRGYVPFFRATISTSFFPCSKVRPVVDGGLVKESVDANLARFEGGSGLEGSSRSLMNSSTSSSTGLDTYGRTLAEREHFEGVLDAKPDGTRDGSYPTRGGARIGSEGIGSAKRTETGPRCV